MKNKFPITTVLNFLKTHKTFILLESSMLNQENHYSYIFINPLKVICCYKQDRIKQCFDSLQKERDKGHYLCGFISYEAGYAFIKKIQVKQHHPFPLVWMGVFAKPISYNHKTNTFNQKLPGKEPAIGDSYSLSNLKLNISEAAYKANIKKIKQLIETGDTYQVNYTAKYKFDFRGSGFALYKNLRNTQQVNYSAFVKSPDFSILSFSPELFFRQEKDKIYVRPMKGTMPRGINIRDDLQSRQKLRFDEKNRAENIMIVDLLRNDLGKISKIGTVKVTRLFCVETYKTLLQMTSTVKSQLNKGITIYDLFSSLFPSGSVTGAPKIRTMEIINAIETENRKIYTGSIGYFTPEGKAVFNVAIRTLLIQNKEGEMGVGSGITYSSNTDEEFRECTLKAEFLTRSAFQLMETILWSKNRGPFLLELHLLRLKRSADFLGFAYSKKRVLSAIKGQIKNLSANLNYKLRILLNTNGKVALQAIPLKAITQTKVCLSKHRVKPDDLFLYHKTTNRSLYDREYKKYNDKGFFDVLFLNNRGEISEGAISTIFIRKKGVFYTPPLSSGLLPGVFREHFILKHRKKVKEKSLTLQDLEKADEIFCANSVRGMVKVTLATC